MQIAEHRKRRSVVDATMWRNNPSACNYSLAKVDPDNPLVRKLHCIQSRSQEKKHQMD